MSGNMFLSNKTKKMLEKDLEKRSKIEKLYAEINAKIKHDMDEVYKELDTETMFKIFNHIQEHGNEKQKEALELIQERYNKKMTDGGGLLIEDTLNLADWYDIMCRYHENDEYLGR